MNRPWMLVAVACCVLGGGCSRLFDPDRKQCERAADCAAFGGTAATCVEGLCAATDENPAADGQDAAPLGSEGDGGQDEGNTSGDGDQPGDGDPAGDGDQPGDDHSSHDAGEGAEDAAVTDAGLPDCPADTTAVLFCDGFEDDFTAWEHEADGDTRLALTSSTAARGKSALKAETLVRGDRWAEVRASFAEARAPLWTRAFVWADSSMRYEAFSVLRIQTAATDSEGIDVSLSSDPPRALLFANVADEEVEAEDAQDFPLDRWVCLELELTADLTISGTASLHVDGKRVASVDTLLPDAALEEVRAGVFFTADGQEPVSVLVDAVAVSTERIGCD